MPWAGTCGEHHRRLAAVLEASGQVGPEVLAVHFERAGDRDHAGHYYALAADQAAETLAFDRAAKLYRLALELRPMDEVQRRPMHTKFGDALANAGRGPEAAQAYIAAAAGASPADALELHRRAALQWLTSGHIDEGLDTIRRVLTAVGMKLPETPRRALPSLLFQRCRLRLRGLKFREREADQIPARELTRIDICWSVAAGLSGVDFIRGIDFQIRSLLLALRAGEPYRIARALAWQVFHIGLGGGFSSRRTAKLLQAADVLAQRVGHPHALGMAMLGKLATAFFQGRWKAARELVPQAEAIFRERCIGAAWELDGVQSLYFWSLYWLGEVAELRSRLPLLLKEAQDRGDLYVATSVASWVGHLVWLAADDPDGAERELHEVLRKWSQRGFHLQHLGGVFGQTSIALYRGDGRKAWEFVTKHWSAIVGSQLLRMQQLRIMLLDLRGRSALAAGAVASDPARFIRAARQDARRLEREKMSWSDALAQLLSAGVAGTCGNTGRATKLLAEAAARFEAVDMPLYAAAAHRRLGQLLGGDEGRSLVAKADAWMRGQNIKNPARMGAIFAPGFPE